MRLIKGIAFPLYFLMVVAWRRRPWQVRAALLTLTVVIGACGFITGATLPGIGP